MVSPPMMPGQERGDHATEDEEQQDHHQRHGEHLGPLLVGGDGSGQLVGQRQQTGQLDIDTRVGQVLLDGLVVLQDEVVVVALELDRHERVLLVRVCHVAQQIGGLEVADRPQDLVWVVLFDLGEAVEHLLAEGRVVDRLAVRGGVDRDDMARGVPAVVLVAEARRLRGFAAFVEEAALCDVLAEAAAVDAAAKAQRHHDCDHGESVAVYRSTPPGEND